MNHTGHKRRVSHRTLMSALAARPPKPWEGDSFDTETYQGWARLICTPDDWIELPRGSWRKAFRFLVDHGPRLTAFNMRFDAEAILKHLPTNYLRTLLEIERLDVDRWSLQLIPWKMIRIEDVDTGGHVEMFDIAQFFGAGLDKVAQTYLGRRKSHKRLGVDPAKLNTDPEAWRDLAPIIRYCQDDAHLTRQATDMVAERFNRLGGSFDTPYSVAYVTADILMRDVEVPRLDAEMMPLADQAFYGGRFECLQRGRFHDASSYDIKSAYPAAMMDLEDAHKGRWVSGKRVHKDALHAIIEAEADVPRDEHPHMAPLPYRWKRNAPLVYPTGRFLTTVHKATYERFEDLLTPRKVWSFIPQGEIVRPYRKTLAKLVAFREDQDVLLSDAAKRGGNSIYGKTRSRHTHRRLVPVSGGEVDTLTDDVVVTPRGVFSVHATERRGVLYNSHHAALVTEACRLTIWDACAPITEDVVMVMTDGFIANGAPLGTEAASVAGEIGYVGGGDTVSCGSGEYEIRGLCVKTRGFFTDRPGKNSSLKTWFGALRGLRDPFVTVTNVRPAHLSECLAGTTRFVAEDGSDKTLRLKDANTFVKFRRTINVVEDDKRVWPHIGEGRRLLNERFVSIPIEVDE